MKNVLCGSEMDRMPDWAFKIMAFMFKIGDLVKPPDKRLDPFKIGKGQTVIDYGCGTGRYLKQASELTGETGKVYAVDIHPLAVESVKMMIRKYNLKNVYPILTDGKTIGITALSADVVYALDMFHMVKDTRGFLAELHRITKAEGMLYLEDGHQPRVLAKKKVIDSGFWEIMEETSSYLKCHPKIKNTDLQ